MTQQGDPYFKMFRTLPGVRLLLSWILSRLNRRWKETGSSSDVQANNCSWLVLSPCQLRSCGRNLLHDDRTNLSFPDRAFSHAAPAVWNSLPPDIVSDLSCLATFKRLVKTQLYNRAYLRWLVTTRTCDSSLCEWLNVRHHQPRNNNNNNNLNTLQISAICTRHTVRKYLQMYKFTKLLNLALVLCAVNLNWAVGLMCCLCLYHVCV